MRSAVITGMPGAAARFSSTAHDGRVRRGLCHAHNLLYHKEAEEIYLLNTVI